MFAQRITAVKAFFQEHHHLPRRRSEDRHEQTLANWLDQAKQRKGRALSSKPCKRQLTPTEAAQLDELLDVEILAPDASTEAMQEREAELCARCRMPYYENANFCAGCGYKRFGTAPSQASKDKASPEPEYESEEDEREEEAAKNQHKKGRPKPNIASQPEKSRAKTNSTIQQEDDEDEALQPQSEGTKRRKTEKIVEKTLRGIYIYIYIFMHSCSSLTYFNSLHNLTKQGHDDPSTTK